MTEKKEKKQVKLIRIYQRIFNSDEGKQVLYDLMRRSNTLSSSFNGMDYLTMAYNEGRRSIILYILSMIDSDPEALKQLMEKSIEDDNDFK
jgi:hypothetical protein